MSVVRYIKPLSRIGLTDAAEVGRKAAVLGELLAAGYQVPAGFAISAAACTDGTQPGDQARGHGAELAEAAVLAPELMAELKAALDDLGDGPVAVRSSAVDEDTATASFAGQYESVLNVDGLGAVAHAVRHCQDSARSERVTVYRHDLRPARPMGVLVQRMVPADAAGAAFSMNPVSGDPGETLVSAVLGLGDQLLAGEVTAEEWVVRGHVAEQVSGIRNALQPGQVRAIAELTGRVAEHFGTPQDVEWAIADQALWLIQARPVTALPSQPPTPVPLQVDVPPGLWTRGPGSDRPWTPMQRSVYLPALAEHLKEMFAFSMLGPPQVREIGGWLYLSLDGRADGGPADRAERAGAAIAADQPRLLLRRWRTEWKPEFARRIAGLRDVDLTALADRDLTAYANALATLFSEFHAVYFRLVGASSFMLGQLGLTCEELLGWSAEQTIQLRGGLRGDHMAAIVALADLAKMAAQRPGIRAELERVDSATAERLASLDADFAGAFCDYCRAYAQRTGGFDITEPTLAEQPLVLLNLVRAQLDRPFDLEAERADLDLRIAARVTAADAILAGSSAAQRARFHAALAESHENGEIRDEKVFYAVSVWALLRYAALELGSRLAGRGQLARPGDVLFLGLHEALDALLSGAGQQDRAWRRRGQDAWANANPGPPSYGTPAVVASMTAGQISSLSPAARTAVETSSWTMRLWAGGPPEQAHEGGVLRGTAASAGRYTGPVRLITAIPEFSKLRRGDVLVCPQTTAQWAVLFPSIGALVTDKGGLLSHPAIIAREYGVPAVIATGDATRQLHDDQIVTVDGTNGTVRPG